MVRWVGVSSHGWVVVAMVFLLCDSVWAVAQASKERLERSEQWEHIKDELAEERLIEENIIEEDIIEEDIVDEDEVERKRWEDAWERRERQRDQVEDDLQRDREIRRRYR